MVDDEVITYYFELNKRIAIVKGRLKKMRFDFYQQTMSSYCTSDEQKIYTKGFRVEKKVIAFVDAEAMALGQLDIMRFKHKHFVKYLKQLSSADRYFLTRKHKWHEEALNERVERECFEELLEIEEAAGYRFDDYEPYIRLDEIEETSSASYGDAMESCFEKMMAMLGV